MSSRLPEDDSLPQALVQVWREDRADDAEVGRSYRKFLQKRPARARAPALQVVRWLLAGMLLGMGTVYAATGAPLRLFGLGSQATEAKPINASPRVVGSGGRSAPLRDPALPASAAIPVPELAREQPSPEPPHGAPALAASAQEHWQRAARGLRERDFDTANAALVELAARGSAPEREAAQLVRAQLLLSQGRSGEALSLLRVLQVSARSPSVRQKSAELLARPAEASKSQRSFEPAPDTKHP